MSRPAMTFSQGHRGGGGTVHTVATTVKRGLGRGGGWSRRRGEVGGTALHGAGWSARVGMEEWGGR
jgi:hypothetical protein